jgi:hypothetical protein
MTEITKSGPLLDSNGKLIDIGYMRKPLKDFNEE